MRRPLSVLSPDTYIAHHLIRRSPLLALLNFSVPQQIGNYPLARARLRLIDFFRRKERALTAVRSRPALPFSDETHDRDRENRDAESVRAPREGRRSERRDEEAPLSSPGLSPGSVLRHTESIEISICVDGPQDNDDKVKRKEKKNKRVTRKQCSLDACNCSPPKLDRSALIHAVRESGTEKKGKKNSVRLTARRMRSISCRACRDNYYSDSV